VDRTVGFIQYGQREIMTQNRGKWGDDPNTNCENGILIRSEKVQHDPRIVSVGYDPMHSTIRHDTNRGQYNTIGLHCTVRYSTYKPLFVLYFLGEYSTVRYDTNRELYNTIHIYGKPRTVLSDATLVAHHPTVMYGHSVFGLRWANFTLKVSVAGQYRVREQKS
jgi:hypothetical protein